MREKHSLTTPGNWGLYFIVLRIVKIVAEPWQAKAPIPQNNPV